MGKLRHERRQPLLDSCPGKQPKLPTPGGNLPRVDYALNRLAGGGAMSPQLPPPGPLTLLPRRCDCLCYGQWPLWLWSSPGVCSFSGLWFCPRLLAHIPPKRESLFLKEKGECDGSPKRPRTQRCCFWHCARVTRVLSLLLTIASIYWAYIMYYTSKYYYYLFMVEEYGAQRG